MEQLFRLYAATRFSNAVRHSTYGFAAIEMLHLVALAVFGGGQSIGDLLVALVHRGDGGLDAEPVEDAEEDEEADDLHHQELRLDAEMREGVLQAFEGTGSGAVGGGFGDCEQEGQHGGKGVGGATGLKRRAAGSNRGDYFARNSARMPRPSASAMPMMAWTRILPEAPGLRPTASAAF